MNMPSRPWQRRSLIVLGGVMLLALLLRIRGLSAESAWWDEYASASFLHLPTLGEFLRSNRTLDPASMPLYFVIEYFWAKHVDDSLYGLRMLSVLFGVLTVPVVYRLGLQLGGAWAGGIAAVLLALSPVHIHHSQGIRMYALFVLLAACSYGLFLETRLRPSKKTTAGYALTSFLLYWTHPFAPLVSMTQAVWFLPPSAFKVRELLKWGLLHTVLILPAFLYLARLHFWPAETTAVWLRLPSFPEWLGDVFYGDIIAFGWQLRSGTFTRVLGPARAILDVATALLVLLVLLRCMRWPRCDADPETMGSERPKCVVFLFSWLIAPPLALYLLSMTWRPCIFPRYTAYAPLAIYLIAGTVIASLPRRKTRGLCAALAVACMLLQYLHTLPEPQRTDWFGAAKLIAQRCGPGDAVLVENALWRDVFVFNAKHATADRLRIPIAAAATPELLAAQTRLLLGDMRQDPASVWIVSMRDYFDDRPPTQLFQELEAINAAYRYFRFPAICTLYVVQVEGGDACAEEPCVQGVLRGLRGQGAGAPATIGHDAMQALGDLATRKAFVGRTAFAGSVLQELVTQCSFAEKVYRNLLAALNTEEGIRESAEAVQHLWEAYGYRENGLHARALEAFALAANKDPHHALAWLEMGLEQIKAKQFDMGAKSLRRAIGLDGEYHPIFSRLAIALERQEQVDVPLGAALAYSKGLQEIAAGRIREAAAVLETALEADPELHGAMNSLGYVLTLLGEYDLAQAMLNDYLAAIQRPDAGALANLAIIHIVRDQPEAAWHLLEKAFQADPGFSERFRPLFEKLLIHKDHDAVLNTLKELKNKGIHLPPAFVDHVQNKRDGGISSP